MSRLIDADALLSKGPFVVRMNDFGEYFVTVEEINKMPTVDAVPIEWIKNYIKRTENNGNTFAAVQYEMMLWDYLADEERRSDEQQ